MPSFQSLDVAIGMIFVYLLLSLICSSLNEGLESFLRNRATDLETGIRNLLGDAGGSWWASFLPWINSIKKQCITREFYQHPLIRNLFRSENRLPTYIPARNFALAVMDIVSQDGSLLSGATSQGAAGNVATLNLAERVNGVPLPPALIKSVTALVIAAKGDSQQARLNIENWFNSSMDRVSGWYKTRTQYILFTIGLVVTVLVNADSLTIFQNLSHTKNLEAVVGTAQTAAANATSTSINQAMAQLNSLDLGIGWIPLVPGAAGTIDRAKLPPNFNFSSACPANEDSCRRPLYWSWQLLLKHGLGWLITGAAIALGAPFWFDTLNRFIVVRSTVKPREKSVEEPSKN